LEQKRTGVKVLVAVTGASGSIYAQDLIHHLLPQVSRVYLCVSETAKKVVFHELEKNSHIPGGFSLRQALLGKQSKEEKEVLRIFQPDDFFAPVASGSAVPDRMVILPCSMGSLARIVTGVSSSLIERAADVMLKQKKPLLICPRESPLNQIHLKNLLELSRMGAHIIPAMPGFYQKPKTLLDLVHFMTGRVLEVLELQHSLYESWNPKRQ